VSSRHAGGQRTRNRSDERDLARASEDVVPIGVIVRVGIRAIENRADRAAVLAHRNASWRLLRSDARALLKVAATVPALMSNASAIVA
jgi:hypothetical protein